MAKYLALDKVATFFKIIKENGGIVGSAIKLFRQDELKTGTLVGVDELGNKYFENKSYFIGRSRWVEYNVNFNAGFEFDASQVAAEWYGWLHYKTDYPPYLDPGRPKYPWMLGHQENVTGTTYQYYPYSTTQPKVESWVPPKK